MNPEQIHNKKELKEKREVLRKSLTPAEAYLWKYLQNNNLGRKFRRQHSVKTYILDFYCATEKLAIELDGAYHFTEAGYQYDEERSKILNQLNIRVIRFENKDVFQDTQGVIDRIKSFFTD